MAKVKFTDEALTRAATAVGEAMLAALPGRDACGHVFSPGFERKIGALVEREKRRGRARKLAQRAAAVILAVLVGLGGWLAVDQEARAAFFSWVREVYETHIVYRFNGESPTDTVPKYRLGWVPEGYAEDSMIDDETLRNILYVNADGSDGIIFSYYQVHEGMLIQIYEPASDGVEVWINGNSGYFYESQDDGGMNELLWIDETQNLAFGISSTLPMEEMLHIAEGIYLEDLTK